MGKKTKQFQKDKRNYTNSNNETEEEDLKEDIKCVFLSIFKNFYFFHNFLLFSFFCFNFVLFF